jgi:hypothetical protein
LAKNPTSIKFSESYIQGFTRIVFPIKSAYSTTV